MLFYTVLGYTPSEGYLSSAQQGATIELALLVAEDVIHPIHFEKEGSVHLIESAKKKFLGKCASKIAIALSSIVVL